MSDLPYPDYDLSYDVRFAARGLDPADLARMRAAELEPDEAAPYEALGITCPKVIWGWKARGTPLETVAAWHRAGYLPKEAEPFLKHTTPAELPVTHADVRVVREQGVGLDHVTFLMRGAGLDVHAALRWQAARFNAVMVKAWQAAGFEAAAAQAWRDEARVQHADEAARWRDAGFAPAEAAGWRALAALPATARSYADLGLAPDDPGLRGVLGREAAWAEHGIDLADAVAWTRRGVPIGEARTWSAAGFGPDEAADLANRDQRHGTRAAGGSTPAELVAETEGSEPSGAAARERPVARRARPPATPTGPRSGLVTVVFWGLSFPDAVDKAPWDPTGPHDLGWRGGWQDRFLLGGGDAAELERLACVLDAHGGAGGKGEFWVPYVAVAESVIVHDGWGALTPTPWASDWEARLQRFCDALGVPYTEPGWRVAAIWEG